MNDYSLIEINALTFLPSATGDEASLDGYKFLQRTIDEWKSGANTFSKPGEKFWAIVIRVELWPAEG